MRDMGVLLSISRYSTPFGKVEITAFIGPFRLTVRGEFNLRAFVRSFGFSCAFSAALCVVSCFSALFLGFFRFSFCFSALFRLFVAF